MSKYSEWTLGQIEALINMVGGDEVARAVLRGERRMTVEEIVRQSPPPRPPLVGNVWKTIVVPAYKAKNFADAVRLGNFDNRDALGDVTRQWGKEPVGLDKPVKIDLIEFNRDWWYEEALAWGKEHNKPLMKTAPTMGIAIKLPDEQRERPIVQLGSARGGDVLCLRGHSDWRYLDSNTVEGLWYRGYVIGFLSE